MFVPIYNTTCYQVYENHNSEVEGTLTLLQSQMLFSGEQPGDYVSLESGPRLIISGNGSVLIRTVDPSHEGHYTCQASNGIGSGLSKVIFLRVNGKYILK